MHQCEDACVSYSLYESCCSRECLRLLLWWVAEEVPSLFCLCKVVTKGTRKIRVTKDECGVNKLYVMLGKD